MIYFAIQCHNFQRRMIWQLSSIAQQINPPDMVIDIASLKNNGIPATEKIIAFFKNNHHMNIRHTLITDKELFAKRGLVRNLQLQNAYADNATHIYFSDADHVYPTDFFSCLQTALESRFRRAQCLLFSPQKVHTDIERTDRIMTNQAAGLLYVEDAYKRAQAIPVRDKIGKCCAAGCMQVASLSAVRIRANGLYVDPLKCKDSHLFRTGQGAKSDKQFRASMGGCRQVHLPMQIHLDHRRDKESGKHLEYQR